MLTGRALGHVKWTRRVNPSHCAAISSRQDDRYLIDTIHQNNSATDMRLRFPAPLEKCFVKISEGAELLLREMEEDWAPAAVAR